MAAVAADQRRSWHWFLALISADLPKSVPSKHAYIIGAAAAMV
jgi:hypothetical protein